MSQLPHDVPDEPLSLEVITASSDNVPQLPDPTTALEIRDWELQQKKAALERYAQDTAQKKVFAGLIYKLVVGWMIGVFLVLFCQGFSWFSRPLADGVLMWLVGGSTGSILGILYAVIANLFPKSPV
jgi:hypothetical protein